jgi:hypothetical protein
MRRLLMRAYTLFALVLLAGCAESGSSRLPPIDRFYFPTGLVLDHPSGSTNGVLYVASSDFDKRYSSGSITQLNLDAVGDGGVGLSAFGAPVPSSGPVQIEALNVTNDHVALITPFAGEMTSFRPDAGTLRLFVPSRSENNRLQIVDVGSSGITCGAYAGTGSPIDCGAQAPSLSIHAKASDPTGKPAAPSPFGVAVSADGTLYVTALSAADSPFGSLTNFENFLVRTSAAQPQIQDSSFQSLGQGGADSVVVGARYAYVSGRFLTAVNGQVDVVLRLFDTEASGALALRFPLLESQFHVIEARGIALNATETRLYLVGRTPDTLLVMDLFDAASGSPRIQLNHAVPLPVGADRIKMIERPGKAPLAVITCSIANSVAIYDDETGQLADIVENVGSQPSGLAIDPIGAGARIYTSNFTDGRVAVIDLPDSNRPQDARVVAHLGKLQTCLVRADDPSCLGSNP